jgi:membrane-associated phospholipid phosphatase
MEGLKSISERDIPGVKPLALSRQTISTIVVIAIVLWSSAFFLWRQVELDKWLLISHNGLRTNELVVSVAQVATKYGMSIIVLVYLLYLLFAFKYEKLRDAYRIYLLVFLMFGFAGIGGDILKEIVDRPRPFVEYAGEINALSNAETPAFPSGHATKSMALALPFLLLIAAKDNWHKGVKILLAIIAFGVCYSRVLLVLQRDFERHQTSEVLESLLAARQVTAESHFMPFSSTGGDFGSLFAGSNVVVLVRWRAIGGTSSFLTRKPWRMPGEGMNPL